MASCDRFPAPAHANTYLSINKQKFLLCTGTSRPSATNQPQRNWRQNDLFTQRAISVHVTQKQQLICLSFTLRDYGKVHLNDNFTWNSTDLNGGFYIHSLINFFFCQTVKVFNPVNSSHLLLLMRHLWHLELTDKGYNLLLFDIHHTSDVLCDLIYEF